MSKTLAERYAQVSGLHAAAISELDISASGSADKLSAMTALVHAKLLRYRLLVDLSARLVSLHEVDEVLSALHESIGTLFDAPVTVLALLEHDGHWQCLTLEGQDAHRKAMPMQPDGLLERVLRGELTHTDDAAAYAERHRLIRRRLDQASNLRLTHAWMGIPLRLDGRAAGVLSIQSYQRSDFSQDDLELLQLLAVHLGIAIENAQLRQRLEREARTDALTLLGNRRSFLFSGERARQSGEPLSLAVMDVQNFKAVNDEFGHPAGDAVLAGIGELLKGHAQPDGQAFRLGGDEFALLLPGTFEEAHARLSSLAQAVAQASWNVAAPITLNIGLAELEAGQSFSALVRRADHGMYDAKRRAVALVTR